MGTVIARRLALLVPTMLLVSFMVFSLGQFIPGDPAIALAGGPFAATPERVAAITKQLGLDKPFVTRYWDWLQGAVHGDLGSSLRTQTRVGHELISRIPITASIAFAGVFVGLLIAVPIGLIAGMRSGSRLDRGLMTSTVLGIAVPNFFLAEVLIIVFAIRFHWLPVISLPLFYQDPLDWLRHVILPAVAIGVGVAASLARQLRAALSQVMSSSYVRTAWAKGGNTFQVVGTHALKNAAIPAVTVLGLQIGALLGGTVLIEQIFSIAGMGDYMIRAIQSADLPVIQGAVLLFAIINVTLALLVDLSYGLLNPKVRVS